MSLSVPYWNTKLRNNSTLRGIPRSLAGPILTSVSLSRRSSQPLVFSRPDSFVCSSSTSALSGSSSDTLSCNHSAESLKGLVTCF